MRISRSKVRFSEMVLHFKSLSDIPAPTWRRNGGLQTVDEGHHPVALVRIRQAAAHCAKIVSHMRWVRGAGNNCRHPFISEQVFEKKLRPAAGEVLSPVRNRLAAHGAEEATTTERLGGQHAGLDLGRQRQDALLRFPVAD